MSVPQVVFACRKNGGRSVVALSAGQDDATVRPVVADLDLPDPALTTPVRTTESGEPSVRRGRHP